MSGARAETTEIFERIRSLRIETAALLTAVREVFGVTEPPSDLAHIPEECMPQYHRQVQEKRIILKQDRAASRRC